MAKPNNLIVDTALHGSAGQFGPDSEGDFAVEGRKLAWKDQIPGAVDVPSGLQLSSIRVYPGYWHNTSGRFVPGDDYRSSPKLEINSDRLVYVTMGGEKVANIRFVWFDLGGSFISTTMSTSGAIAPPATAMYVGMNFQLSVFPTANFENIYLHGVINEVSSDIENSTDTMMSISDKGILYDSNSTFFMHGASFASPDNGWFEIACEKLGVAGINKAGGSTYVSTLANAMKNNTAWTPDEFEQFTHLVLFYSHEDDVADGMRIRPNWRNYTESFVNGQPGMNAMCYDYIIKKYISLCYDQKDVAGSKWFGTPHGKPVNILICTHWHDARYLFNSSVRRLCARWRIPLIAFDENIGFTANEPIVMSDGTFQQPSIMYAYNTEVVNDLTVGWHPLPGKEQYIQQRMAKIFTDIFINSTEMDEVPAENSTNPVTSDGVYRFATATVTIPAKSGNLSDVVIGQNIDGALLTLPYTMAIPNIADVGSDIYRFYRR